MSRALEDLDNSIKAHLQNYLKRPVVERTQAQYDILVDRLARTAMAYAKALVEERRAARKSERWS